MDCGICATSFASRGQPTCASCARALLYQARLDHLTNLLSRESLQKTVAVVLTPPQLIDPAALSSGSEVVDLTEAAARHKHSQLLDDTQAIDARCLAIEKETLRLSRQMEDARAEMTTRMTDNARRRQELAKEKDLLAARLPQLLEPVDTATRHARKKLDKVHSRTREGRVKLCHETARLAGLLSRRRKTSDGNLLEEYMIGQVPIPDLRHLNAARPDQASAALANISRLLITTCHYLSIRLPAEVTPPHANYPHPTIFSLQSSYQGFELPFPGTSSAMATMSSPSNSKLLEHRSLPKLRMLHLDRPLVRLAREDHVSYNLFVEGVTLLAWDVAWLCRSQGLAHIESWDQVCELGKNLCLLFRTDSSAHDGHDQPSVRSQSIPTPQFGELSQAGTCSDVESPMGIALMRNWHLASPHRVIDKVKSHLLTEMSGAEWELIAESEWDVEREDERAVLVGGRRPADDETGAVRDKSSSGWTKLKSRGTDAA